ncbi:MAG: hypothetical protein WBL45_05855 [Solirubrobacterales bacterium]
MIGRKAATGLSLLSALLFCAIAAQGALAVEKESTNTTAFTCAAGSGAGFSDAHCDKAVGSGASFVHTAIANGTQTKIGGNNEKVTNSTKDIESAVLKGKIGITATEITCEKYIVDETKSFIENSEPSLKDHKVKGTVRAEFKTCKVFQPLKCTIDEPVVVEATFVGVDGLTGPKTEENAMGLRFKGEKESGASKDVFASITYRGAECALKDKTFPVTGTAIATAGPGTDENQETNKHTGATLVFKGKSAAPHNVIMQKLHIGVEANKAEFETIATSKMAENGNPISLTTTT